MSMTGGGLNSGGDDQVSARSRSQERSGLPPAPKCVGSRRCCVGAVTLSGAAGEDAKPYQEKQVKRAIEEVEQ